MMEHRRAKRIDTNLKIKMEPIDSKGEAGPPIMADVVNISKTGVGFLCSDEIADHSYYKACLVLESKDSVDAVIETVRHVPENEKKIMYGGRFIGMNKNEQFKIEVFRMFTEHDREQAAM